MQENCPKYILSLISAIHIVSLNQKHTVIHVFTLCFIKNCLVNKVIFRLDNEATLVIHLHNDVSEFINHVGTSHLVNPTETLGLRVLTPDSTLEGAWS